MKCAVGKCMRNDRKKSNVSFYTFPKNNEQQRKLWITFCKRKDTIKILRERICSLHFRPDDFERNFKFEMGCSNRATLKLKPGAVPTIDATDNINCDVLENLADYICHKIKNKEPSIDIKPLEDSSYSWVNHLSEGGLSKPSISLMNILKSCDEILMRLNGDKLFPTNDYSKKQLVEAKDVKAIEEVKKLFFRCTMYFRLRSLNAEIKQNISSRKRKYTKTLT